MSHKHLRAANWLRGRESAAITRPHTETVRYVDNTDAEGIRIRTLLRLHGENQGFRLSIAGRVRQGKLKRYTHHLGHHGAVVRFKVPGQPHHHAFFTIMHGRVVYLGDAPPPSKEPGWVRITERHTHTMTFTQTRTFRR